MKIVCHMLPSTIRLRTDGIWTRGVLQQGVVYLRYVPTFTHSKLAERLSLFGLDKIRKAWLAWHWRHGTPLMVFVPRLPLTAVENSRPNEQQVFVKMLWAFRGYQLDKSS